ncbi:hypothetical protein IAU59_005955 [Kwoniella sp. CBS 9459]
MPLPSLHPLPANPTTGQQPLTTLSGRSSSSTALYNSHLNTSTYSTQYGNGYSHTMHSTHAQSVPPTNSSASGGVNRETLKGLQDVYWSDDEDDPDCLLCAEPLDLSDLNFKPCQCGLQICQFCYNKLLSTDARCPGCRRPYDAKAVVFQPVDWEEVKRAKERKTKRAKVIKQLTQMGRRNLLGVRIVMKNMVYVVGMKLPAPGDEAIPILRSNDYFGQYGKISKLYLGDRSKLSSTAVSTLTPDNPSTSTGIYIVYIRREDAARAISALDGIPAPQGPPGAVLKATYGTTRYCDAFLRGVKCDNNSCHNLHEWGGESDCFSKEDFEIALTRPAEYDARQKQTIAPPPSLSSKTAWPKPSEDVNGSSSGLPSAASWGKNITVKTRAPAASAIARPTKIGGNLVPLGKNSTAFPLPSPAPSIPIIIKEKKEKRSAALARTKSTDSTTSGNTTSAQTSPKKKPITLPLTPASTSTPASDAPSITTHATSALTSAPPPPPPPPGLLAATTSASTSTGVEPSASLASSPPAPASAPIPDSVDDSTDERFSADSDAGPSSSSPAPQTPARSTEDIPPAPLSSEPILIHSPYPEPVIFSFPAHDKDFAFSLGLDENELQRRQEQAEGYEPSPFSKTLEGLAELGVHAPELPDLFAESPGPSGYHGLFRPFDLPEEPSPSTTDSNPGPSRSRDDHNAQRTESRFGFARPSSASTSVGVRGQSPFSHLRRSIAEPPVNLRDGWYTRQQMSDEPLQQQQQQHHLPQHQPQQHQPQQHQQSNDPRTAALAAQVASFVGSYDSSAATESGGWAGADSVYAASPSHGRQLGLQQQQQQYGDRGNASGNERRLEHALMQGGGFMQKALRAERDDYDPPVLQYGNTQIYGNSSTNPNQGQGQPPQGGQGRGGLFSPESGSRSIHDDSPFQQSPMAFSQLQAQGLHHHHQQQQQQLQPQHPDARTLMQLHHQRGQSPTPLVAQAYRRF